MPDYIEPTSSDFNSAEQVMLDVLSSTYPKTQTKAGSTLRELLVRPLAYIYAWCAGSSKCIMLTKHIIVIKMYFCNRCFCNLVQDI